MDAVYFEEKLNEYGEKELHIREGSLCWVGMSHDSDERGYYTYLYIEDSLKNLKKKYKFKYFEKQIFL